MSTNSAPWAGGNSLFISSASNLTPPADWKIFSPLPTEIHDVQTKA